MDKYFVANDGNTLSRIYFSLEDAKASGPPYIDIFDENGKPVTVLHLEDGQYIEF
ncbi:MAG: hypothetical protein AABY22_24550 [Nanoarchaeota archaeon]